MYIYVVVALLRKVSQKPAAAASPLRSPANFIIWPALFELAFAVGFWKSRAILAGLGQ